MIGGSRPERSQTMHIPDSALDAKVIVTTVAIGAAGLAVAVRRLERRAWRAEPPC